MVDVQRPNVRYGKDLSNQEDIKDMSNKITEHKDFLLGVASWIKKVSNEKACLPEFKDFMVINSKNIKPTPEEVYDQIHHMIARAEHPTYMAVYHPIGGWQTMIMCWQRDSVMDDGGFYEPWTTGMGPYGHTKKGYEMACREAKSWAEDEGIEDVRIPIFKKGNR